MSSDQLPVLRDGDKFTGAACIQPAHLCYCSGCKCLRRYNKRWTTRKDADGMTEYLCQRHAETAAVAA
jgi:hypothetical protein